MMKKVMKIVVGIVIAVMILAFGGCALTLFTANKAVEEIDKSIKKDEKKEANKEELLQVMLDKAKPVETKDEFTYSVEYTLKNDTKESFDYIQLEADVFDKNGVKLGNNMTNITEVKPGQTFKLVLDLFQEGAASYKITKISSEPF